MSSCCCECAAVVYLEKLGYVNLSWCWFNLSFGWLKLSQCMTMKPLKPSWEKTYVLTSVNVLIINQVRSEGTCLTNYQGLFTCITFSTLLTARNAHLNENSFWRPWEMQLDIFLCLPRKEKWVVHDALQKHKQGYWRPCLFLHIFYRIAMVIFILFREIT